MDNAIEIRGTRIIDLSQIYEPAIPCPPGQPGPELRTLASKAEGDAVNAEVLSIGLHTGTHVDAPFHFYSDRETIDQVALPDRLIGHGVVLDMSHLQGWQPVDAAAIAKWEQASGVQVAAGDIVLLRTDHCRHWVTGTAGRPYVATGWPYVTGDAAEYLVARRIRALGVECLDPDHNPMTGPAPAAWPTHHALLRAGILIIENLRNLAAIDSPTCTVIGLPLLIRGASAAPLRVVAVV